MAPSHNPGLRFIYKMVPSLFTHSLSILWRKQVLNGRLKDQKMSIGEAKVGKGPLLWDNNLELRLAQGALKKLMSTRWCFRVLQGKVVKGLQCHDHVT